MRRRLDAELVRRGLVRSRARGVEMIGQGRVLVGGAPAGSASRLVAPDEAIEVSGPAARYVSRGGDKLAAALDRFGVDPTGLVCVDAGASTGGFTDCLLQRGAARVVAFDVGFGQLDWKLRSDERVEVRERTNVRHLDAGSVDVPADLVTADLSFISLRLVIAALRSIAATQADFVLLVKPQFEAGRSDVGGGGVVRDSRIHRRVLGDVVTSLEEHRVPAVAAMPSPITGARGNIEFLVHARPLGASVGTPPIDARQLDAVVAEAHRPSPDSPASLVNGA